jgi:hypothetical protein
LDLSDSNTEATLRFHRFHERFNRSIKVQAIGLGLLADEIDAGTPPETRKDRLYARPGWLWGGMPDWAGARGDVDAALRDIGQGGVIRAFSAFDLFLDELEGELASWQDFSGISETNASASQASSNETVDADRVERIYERLGASRTRVSDIWAVYRYFRHARNSIAHREGVAARSLVEAFNAPELQPTLDRWIERTGEMTAPALVPAREGKQIEFTHRQAIAASSTLRLIALDLGRLAIGRLGEQGFVYLVARHVFFDDSPPLETLAMPTMVKAFNVAMATRYRVRNYDQVEGLRVLRSLGLTKQCSARFAQLKRQQAALVSVISN